MCQGINYPIFSWLYVAGALASRLVRSTPDQPVLVLVLPGTLCCALGRHFALTVPLFAQVYKWVSANVMLGVTLRWSSIPSRVERKPEISAGLMGHFASKKKKRSNVVYGGKCTWPRLASLQACMTLKLKETKIISKHDRNKIVTGGKQTSWLFTSMTEELNKGLVRNNSILVVRAGLEPATSAFQVRRPNHSDTLSPCMQT